VPTDAPESHPNLPRRGLLALMFAAIVICGALGGAIGYGLVNTSCPSSPTLAERLLEQVPGVHAKAPSCDAKLLAGAVTGTVLAAIGAGVVAMLMLRAQAEWGTHPAGRQLAPPGPAGSGAGGRAPPITKPPITKPQSGETPPHT
jgi:hypothetical protein